jgi:hypothetical protein
LIRDNSFRGELAVSDCTAIPVSRDITGKPYSFELGGVRSDETEESSLILAASSDEDRNAWMTVINSLITQRKSDPGLQTGLGLQDITIETTYLTMQSTPAPPMSNAIDTTNASTPAPDSVLGGKDIASTAPQAAAHHSVSPIASSCGGFYSSADADSSADPQPSATQTQSRFAHLRVNADDFSLDREAAPSGTGGYGVVHRATRLRDGKVCALKFFGYAKRDPSSISVWDEIEVMARLQECPAMVQLEGFFEDTREGLLPGKKFPGTFPGEK